MSDNPATMSERFKISVLESLPWLRDLNHDRLDDYETRNAAAIAFASSPVAAHALLCAQLNRNRPVLSAPHSQTGLRHLKAAFASMSPSRLHSQAAQGCGMPMVARSGTPPSLLSTQ